MAMRSPARQMLNGRMAVSYAGTPRAGLLPVQAGDSDAAKC